MSAFDVACLSRALARQAPRTPFNARADFENWLEYVGIRAEAGTWQQTICRLIMHQQRDPPMNDVDHVKFV